MVAAAPRLRWVHSSAAAVEGLLPLAELARAGITVTNSRGVQAIPMAEHVMGGLLVLSRQFDRTLDAQRERRWIQNELSDDWPWMLHGQSMTIVGLGHDRHRDREARARVRHARDRRAAARRPSRAVDFVDRVFGTGSVAEALDGCDVLVLSAPGVVVDAAHDRRRAAGDCSTPARWS